MTGKVTHQGMSPPQTIKSTVLPEELLRRPTDGVSFGPSEKVGDDDPFPTAAKRNVDLDSLFMLGYIEKEKNIGSFTFKMKTLTNEENQKVIVALNRASNNPDLALEAQDIILAYSLVSVNKVSVEDLYDGPDKAELDVLRQRVKVIRKLQSPVVAELLSLYNEISEESNKKVGVEEVKK